MGFALDYAERTILRAEHRIGGPVRSGMDVVRGRGHHGAAHSRRGGPLWRRPVAPTFHRAGHDLGDRLWGPLDVAGDDDLDSDFNAWVMGWPNEGG